MPPNMNMGQLFTRAVSRFPERTALIDPDVGLRYTYTEWGEEVDRVAAALQASGIGAGDTVAIMMENRFELLTVYWATQQIGAVFVPFNFRAATDEVTFLVNNVSANLLFFADISREAVLNGRDQFETIDDLVYVDGELPDGSIGYQEFGDRGDSYDHHWVDQAEPSLILHTSGTTGNPKGVPISHAANYARTVSNPVHLNWEQGEITLGIMPNFHEMGRAAISSSALLNGTYIAQRRWSPDQALALIEQENISMLYLVPTLFHDIVDYEDLDRYDVSSVRKVGYAGTAMSERVHREVQELFDPVTFVNFYGSSEMNCMTTCAWLDEKPGCSGRAGINTRARVVTPVEGETVPPDDEVEPNELGEIILDASSPEAFDGYLNRPEANETSFEDGWYFTGDLGYKDDDDDIWVVGRVDDMIISGGENIYPVEIEDLLDEHELVRDTAIGCVDDDRWGQLVTAFIQVNENDLAWGDVAATLDDHCTSSNALADFKRPRKYVFVDSIPKSNVGKKLRRMLRADDLDEVEGVTVYEVVDV